MAKKMFSSESVIWGTLLIGVGVILLLDQLFDIEIWSHIWKFWPLLLIAFGISILLDKKK